MKYCTRCIFPENAKPTIIFDEGGVCSGCRVIESKDKLNWTEREEMLREILEHYKAQAKKSRNSYDCIIPVSGGKDSHYQVYVIKEVYGLNPLLVCFNHIYNTPLGIRNLNNIVKQFNCDIIRYTINPMSAQKISRYMLKMVGDLTWHYHTGIFTFPFQIAVKYKIPLVIWGEHGFAEVTGMFRLEDFPEFTKWFRQEHEMRGYELKDIINEESGITWQDVVPLVFPSDEEIEGIGVRGIFLGNYKRWDHRRIVKLLMDDYHFKVCSERREKTFSMFHKIDDHANDVHDYLKYLKFGYGRATDHASLEIRGGRLTREEGIELVKEYDHIRPKTLDLYLNYLGMTEDEFEKIVEPMRDPQIWQKDVNGKWITSDSVVNHVNDHGVEEARVPLVSEKERTFGSENLSLYYSDKFRPQSGVDDKYVSRDGDDEFIIL